MGEWKDDHMYPGMTKVQVDFFREHIENLSSLEFNKIKRKALGYFGATHRHQRGSFGKEARKALRDESIRFMIRYLHKH